MPAVRCRDSYNRPGHPLWNFPHYPQFSGPQQDGFPGTSPASRGSLYSTIKYVIVLCVSAIVPRSETLAGTFPAILQRAGKNALFAADEFFSARISNPHTRRAYARPVGRFLAWCEEQGIELRQVTPGLAGRFIEELPGSDPTRNLALAALRHFFDALVTRHAVALNPFASVRGQKHSVVDGKTPELTIGQARALLGSLDLSRVVGLRDRAVLGVLTYTGARVGALARLRCGDLQQQESQRVLRFTEKGGKQREIPVRHDLDEWIDAYLEAGKIDLSQKAAPLFLAADRWGSGLVDRALTAHGVRRMLKRRLKEAGLPEIICPHSFRVMVVTDLLGQNVPMEDVQYLAGHSNPRTTQIYDRRRRRVTRNIVERISV